MRGALLVVLLGGCDWILSLHDFPADAPVLPGAWAQVAAGETFTCAIDLAGSLWCWGYNGHHELGTGSSEKELDQPTLVGGGPWSTIAAGGEHGCGIQSDGSLWCWGSNWTGQLGDVSTSESPRPIRVGTSTWNAVTTRTNHTCAIDTSDALWCWGDNRYGQVGAGDPASEHDAPVHVAPGVGFTQVAAGTDHTCAIATDGSLWCWGANWSGQLGVNDTTNRSAPIAVGSAWSTVAAGEDFSCGLRDGQIWCWGDNQTNELGDGTSADAHVPVLAVTPYRDFGLLAAGASDACAVRADGSLYCWGDATPGPLDMPASQPTPIKAAAGRWTALSLGRTHACGLGVVHDLWCVGDGSSGELGNNLAAKQPVMAASRIQTLAAGGDTTCVIDTAGAASCWGANHAGQIGDGTYTRRLSTTPLALSAVWTSIAIGREHGCALQGASAFCWGTRGLGDGGPSLSRPQPAPVIANPAKYSGFTRLATNGDHTCAIATPGATVFCWGRNTDYELGTNVGDNNDKAAPTEAAGGKLFSAVAAGERSTCGIESTGKLDCTGNNSEGQGANMASGVYQVFSPSSDTSAWTSISSGSYHACAINGANHASCWGRNNDGELGLGTTTASVPPPTPVIVGTLWKALALGETHTCGIETDNSLVCWGSNDFGQLGNGMTARSLNAVPVVIPEMATSIASGLEHTCALTVTGNVWCWGNNHDGQLGTDAGWAHAFFEVPAPQ